MQNRSLRFLLSLPCALAAVCGIAWPHVAPGHGPPVDLAFWGGYSPGVARCQRTIARASAHCVRDVVAARQTCLTPLLGGVACDTQQLNATIATLRQRALDMVTPNCTSLQLQQLSYADLSEAYRDIIDACRRIDTAITSAVYAPALSGGEVSTVDGATHGCIQVAAPASAKLLDFSIRTRQRALDRIASTQLAPSEKQHLVTRGEERISRVRAELRAKLLARCTATDFTSTYGRDVDSYLDGVAAQGGCHAQYVYVQNAVLCPPSACGNGIQEPNEQCDDGDDFDGDGCRSDCTRGECTVCAQ